ncbi:hypothetical protein F4779DRAFT_160592 [Xylariaceae sp. FL0662B]|nr:hypothetical protein F4779DRAFT_160592 [Xylariaceae sp. FL0662B]
MASSATRYALIATLVGLSAVGFRSTFLPLLHNGLGAVLNSLADGTTAVLPGAPAPLKRSYTDIGALDRQLVLLVGFFSPLIDGDPGWSTTAFYAWGMAQFAAAWTLLVLEGLRSGNRARAVSWVGTVGMIVQTMTWTVTAPLYLALHLATSPVARLRGGNGDGARRALFVYLWDLALLPPAVTLGFVLPALCMSLPGPLRHSAGAHYAWLAFWQAFPVWTVGALAAMHTTCYWAVGSLSLGPRGARGRPAPPGHGFAAAAAGVYEFALAVCGAAHVPIVAVSLLPDALRSRLGAALPAAAAPVLAQVRFRDVFVPFRVSGPPAVDPAGYAAGDLAPLVLHFLQYDMYVGHAALLLWAAYLHATTVRDPSLVKTLRVAGFWFLVGGPAGAAAGLLWDRDEVVKEGETPAASEAETK